MTHGKEAATHAETPVAIHEAGLQRQAKQRRAKRDLQRHDLRGPRLETLRGHFLCAMLHLSLWCVCRAAAMRRLKHTPMANALLTPCRWVRWRVLARHEHCYSPLLLARTCVGWRRASRQTNRRGPECAQSERAASQSIVRGLPRILDKKSTNRLH